MTMDVDPSLYIEALQEQRNAAQNAAAIAMARSVQSQRDLARALAELEALKKPKDRVREA